MHPACSLLFMTDESRVIICGNGNRIDPTTLQSLQTVECQKRKEIGVQLNRKEKDAAGQKVGKSRRVFAR
jgi:hypothetical protein